MAPARVKLKWLTVWAPPAFILLPVISLFIYHPHPFAVWMTSLFIVAGFGLAGAYFFSSFVFSQIRRQEQEIVRTRHERLRDVAVVEERHRIAREMHDGLAQELGYLNLKIGELEEAVSSQPPATLRAELGRMKKVVAGAYEEVRQAIFGLKMTPASGLGLVPTLAEYLREFSEQTGITVELKLAEEGVPRLSPRAEVQVIRIIQEALANVRKHARAGRAWVIFDREGGRAKITVQDDGWGFDPEEATRPARTSLGLESMRERAESVGGTLAVDPGQGRGTQVIVLLPLAGQEAATWRP